MAESWRIVLRDGFVWQWATPQLEAAIELLEKDSPKLTQGSTTTPPPLMAAQDWQVEACDLVAFCSTPDAFDGTVGQAEEGFARACFNADQRLGEPAACRRLLNWWDDTPRDEMRREMISELKREVELRKRANAALPTELQQALQQFPQDDTLKLACVDELLEQGLEAEAETLRASVGGVQ